MLVARYCGEKNYDGVQQTVQTSLLTGLVGGVILVVLGIVLARPMLTLMKTPDEVIEARCCTCACTLSACLRP